jgi:hypothetical protein
MPCPSHPPWLDHSNYVLKPSVFLLGSRLRSFPKIILSLGYSGHLALSALLLLLFFLLLKQLVHWNADRISYLRQRSLLSNCFALFTPFRSGYWRFIVLAGREGIGISVTWRPFLDPKLRQMLRHDSHFNKLEARVSIPSPGIPFACQRKHFATTKNRSILGKYRNAPRSKIRRSFLVYFVEPHGDHKASS